MPEVRLQKALADAGVASRRGAEELILAGRVTVDGAPARVGQRVDPAVARLAVDGRSVEGRRPRVYLALHKPAGVTSTVSDPHAARTVLDLLPLGERRSLGRIYPVGRLDRDSEGLLLLTNDGPWAQRVLHPSHGVEREYAVALARPLSEGERRALLGGLDLPEGRAGLVSLRLATRTETATLGQVVPGLASGLRWYRVVLGQGMKRQIRRMFGAAGVPVERLVRVRIGTLRLDDLRPGDVRRLTAREATRLIAGPGRSGRPRETPNPEGPQAAGRVVSPERHSTAAGGAGLTEESPTNADPPRAGRRLVVALDGPGSSGKSTVGALAAARLGYRFCDTGLLYRAVGWLAVREGIDPRDGHAAAALVPEVALEHDERGRYSRVLARGEDVSDELGSPVIDRAASQVAGLPEVRAALLSRQRDLARGGGIVMAGRDIGSVVLPDADVKVYLDASVEERARRRIEQRGPAAEQGAAADVLAALLARDAADAGRAAAPLRIATDAVVLRTDGHTVEESVEALVAVVESAATGRPA